jgi:hypothetical protein
MATFWIIGPPSLLRATISDSTHVRESPDRILDLVDDLLHLLLHLPDRLVKLSRPLQLRITRQAPPAILRSTDCARQDWLRTEPGFQKR